MDNTTTTKTPVKFTKIPQSTIDSKSVKIIVQILTVQYGKRVFDRSGELVLLSSDYWPITGSMGKMSAAQIPTKSSRYNMNVEIIKI